MTGISAFLRPCFRTTFHSRIPFALAQSKCSCPITSRSELRVSLATLAMGPTDNAITGMRKCCGVPIPPLGKILSFREKIKINRIPNIKLGRVLPTTALLMVIRSNRVLCFTAARTPKGIPITMVSPNTMLPNEIVGIIRSAKRSETERA